MLALPCEFAGESFGDHACPGILVAGGRELELIRGTDRGSARN